MYQYVLKPLFFRFDPELVHNFFVWFGELLGRFGLTRFLTGLVYNYRGPSVGRTIDGLFYRTPIILSAGFDYNARLVSILPQVGFGGVEVGSVTARACAGNSRPRLWRLPRSRSIVVNKGLRNDGVDTIIRRLQKTKTPAGFVVGISIARTNDSLSAVSIQAGIDDYFYTYRRLVEAGVGDYHTLNISCPNAFGGEAFAKPDLLKQLLDKIREIKSDKPLYVKLPINLSWSEIDSLVAVCLDYKINGVIVGNLNKDYSYLSHPEEAPATFRGGVSGEPCRELSTKIIKQIKEKYGDQLTIMGCGGIMSPDDMNEKLSAGADLTQLITGMIYEGPGLIKRLSRSLVS